MSIENVIEYALSKPCNFPGKQNNPTVRTNPNQKSLEPKAQVSIGYTEKIRKNTIRKTLSFNWITKRIIVYVFRCLLCGVPSSPT